MASEKQNHSFISRLSHKKREEAPHKEIQLKDLNELFNNPLKFHYKNKYGLYLSRDEDEPNLFLNHLDKFLFKKQALNTGFDNALADAEKKGSLKKSPFLDSIKKELHQEVGGHFQFLKEQNVHKVYALDFPLGKEFHFHNDVIRISGEIPHISENHFITFKKEEDLVKEFANLVLLYKLKGVNQVITLKDKQIRGLNIDERLFDNMMEYYYASLHNFIPLMPNWVKPILDNDLVKLEKAIKKEFDKEGFNITDPYVRHAFSEHKLKAEDIMNLSKPWADKLFKTSLYESL